MHMIGSHPVKSLEIQDWQHQVEEHYNQLKISLETASDTDLVLNHLGFFQISRISHSVDFGKTKSSIGVGVSYRANWLVDWVDTETVAESISKMAQQIRDWQKFKVEKDDNDEHEVEPGVGKRV